MNCFTFRIRKGDYVWCVLEPFDLKTKLRVVSVESYSDPKKSPVFTFGKVRANIKKTTAKLGRGQSSVSTSRILISKPATITLRKTSKSGRPSANLSS
ncbi:phage tail protein [Gilvibacter sp.]|uniref:phage tail protein n=1 Tax=Gilvibacter sp. TaxID=2729997 RepID=UPI0035BE9F54